jgi:hypothetical protein
MVVEAQWNFKRTNTIRSLTPIVAWWIIVTTNNGATTIVTLHLSTTKTNRIAPNNLSIMQTFTTNTRVRIVVIVWLLSNPHVDSSCSSKVSTAPSKILSIWTSRVY